MMAHSDGAGTGNGSGIQLIVVNNCAESIWPGLLGTAGHLTPQSGGFHLAPGDEAAFDVPLGWSGRVWPRRGCSFDDRERGLCATGDCGGVLRCDGRPGATPATVVEMTLGTPTSQHLRPRLQGRLPQGLQLRLRRRHLSEPVQGQPLPHHLLPTANANIQEMMDPYSPFPWHIRII
jgi:hypothetical protein